MKRDDGHLSVHYRKKALPLSFVRRILRGQQQRIYERFMAMIRPDEKTTVLDLGVNGSLETPEQHFFEYNYPYRCRIVAAGLEEPRVFTGCFPEIRYIQLRRGERLPFDDGTFDVVFCNAVIEHVGTRSEQRTFLKEVLRVSRRAFVTTPNRWYPVDLHTVTPLLHWMPARIYRPLYRRLGFDFFSREENLNLLDRRSLLDMVPESTQAEVQGHRFLGLTSNLILWCRNGSARS